MPVVLPLLAFNSERANLLLDVVAYVFLYSARWHAATNGQDAYADVAKPQFTTAAYWQYHG